MSASEIPTIDPEMEPEYVGAFSAISNDTCQNFRGETREEIRRCGAEATHTVVMGDQNGAHQIAMCDDCGEPEDAATDRVWTGEPTNE